MTWRFVFNRTREKSRDEFWTNQNAPLCDVAYLIYMSESAAIGAIVYFEKRHWELRGKTLKKFL